MTNEERQELMARKMELVKEFGSASSDYQKQRIKQEMEDITLRLKEGTEPGQQQRTTFEAAKQSAMDASELLLGQLKSGLESDAWKKLTNCLPY